ncbi:hypothetical protein AACH10_06340 [Ideonella sp. DXS22W]|uniref:Cytochrome C oxidase subunit I n=1 Tax=Pseudaquabacterium inlustre TaxID=2984192 RepID=A0ABU9CDR3_9BURK
MSGSKSSDPAAAEAPRHAAPADEPLGLVVHSLPSPGDVVVRQRATGRIKMLLVLAVCAAPVIASYFTFYVVRPTGTAYGTLVSPLAMPALEGRTLAGAPQALRGLAGQWLLVAVDSGACAAACEKRLFMQRQLREMTGRERDRIDKLWLVVDDAPVTPALRQALEATPGMNILRLPREAVAAWLKPAPGQALEDHLYIVDPHGQWMMRQPVDADPAKVKRDIERLLRASAGWDQPGRQALIGAAAAAADPAMGPASRP